ncbi:MAG: sugar nucleotide-binding protein [Planctomycetota bacterium]|nr:sugar nucleotide-binding protein [Planctomycetota bacterium]
MSPGHALVFGATGFLGPHLLRCLGLAGLAVVAASRRKPEAGLGFGAEFVPCDGEHEGAGLDRINPADGQVPRAVFYLSAVSSLSAADADPERAWRLNTYWPAELARGCAAVGIPFVYTSTDLVFGSVPPANAARGCYAEADIPSPMGAYGESKRDGEAAVIEAHPGALVARLPLLYGDSFGRGLGASDGLLAAVRAESRPMLFTDELRCAMDAQDAARALVLFGGCGRGLPESKEALLADVEGRAGVLHLSGAARLSRAELGMRLLARAGLGADQALAAVRLGTQADAGLEGKRAKNACLDSSTARRLLASAGLELEEDPLEPENRA